jgi:NADH-quinone oxidoreductase subunit G
VRANVKLRDAVPAGSVFLAEGTAETTATCSRTGLVEIHRIGAGSLEPSAVAAQIQPAVEGLAEAPPPLPLPIPPREVT